MMVTMLMTSIIKQTHSSQKSFFEDVCGLVSTLEELGNPFLDRSKDLLTLHTQEIMPMTVVETIPQIHATAEITVQYFH